VHFLGVSCNDQVAMTKSQRMVVMDKCETLFVAKLQERERPLKMIATLHKKFVDASTYTFYRKVGMNLRWAVAVCFPKRGGCSPYFTGKK
jgi:hypothetical protein